MASNKINVSDLPRQETRGTRRQVARKAADLSAQASR